MLQIGKPNAMAPVSSKATGKERPIYPMGLGSLQYTDTH